MILTRRYDAAGAWETCVTSLGCINNATVLTDPNADVNNILGPVAMAMNPSGDSIAIWLARRAARPVLFANRTPSGAAAGTSVAVGQFDTNEASLVMDTMGRALVVWLQTSTGHQSLWSARFE
jgi:hypothetical protein